MSNNKQTAVEWLEKEFVKLEATIGVYSKMYEIIEQAKEMEKKQIVKFSKVVLKEYKFIRPEELSTIKRLYNETFNTNEK